MKTLPTEYVWTLKITEEDKHLYLNKHSIDFLLEQKIIKYSHKPQKFYEQSEHPTLQLKLDEYLKEGLNFYINSDICSDQLKIFPLLKLFDKEELIKYNILR